MMWEERSCKQTREWQHWGSGCYDYRCRKGHLHIIVANYSFECYHPGQEIHIRIFKNNWLHRGSLVCPHCQEICGAEFEARNETCKKPEEAPPANYYHKDEIKCSDATTIVSSFLGLLSSFFLQLGLR